MAAKGNGKATTRAKAEVGKAKAKAKTTKARAKGIRAGRAATSILVLLRKVANPTSPSLKAIAADAKDGVTKPSIATARRTSTESHCTHLRRKEKAKTTREAKAQRTNSLAKMEQELLDSNQNRIRFPMVSQQKTLAKAAATWC